MQNLYLRNIYIYPVKSLGGIALTQTEVEQTGLQHDRRWMLVDQQGNFLSQRTFAQMAMLQVSLAKDGLVITHKKESLQPLNIPFDITAGEELTVQIWDDVCKAMEVNKMANDWFSAALQLKAKLVYMPTTTHRLVDINYAGNNEVVSFADAYPIMMIGQSSLDDLNNRLTQPVLMNRFRPNLVFNGGTAFCEDAFASFNIGEVAFRAVKPCSRCVLTTINQESGEKGNEPLKTLSTFRKVNNKILFGQNLLHLNAGTIKVGDELTVTQYK